MLYCLNPDCPTPKNPDGNVHCQYCGAPIALRNRFKALSRLGQGGFGATFLAQDLDNRNKPCVVKRLTYQSENIQATAKAQQLFEQEAERLDQLIHPQIPRLLAYFQERGYLYLVQELVEGQTLHHELAQTGPFNEAKIKAVLHGLLPILQFVHSQNIIHRDIKPDNIMRRQNGALVLIDFGVAKLLEQSEGAKKNATTIGTPGYAAPEQIQGRVTPASDLFALGATCFELLTQGFSEGKVPLIGYGWVNHWQQYLNQPISPELKAILTRLIAIAEHQRYPAATAVLSDLRSGGSSSQQPLASNAPSPPGLLSNLPTVAVSPAPPSPPPGSPPAASTPQTPPIQPQVPLQPLHQASSNPSRRVPVTKISTLPNAPNIANALYSANASNSPNVLEPQPPLEGSQSPTTVQKIPVSAGFWLKYGLFSYIGQILGFCVAMVCTALFALRVYPDPQADDMAILLRMVEIIYWLVGSFVVSLFQWLALRKWLPQAIWWVPVTVSGCWVIALARMATGDIGLLGSLVVGTVVGTIQWTSLREHKPRAHWWIVWIALMLTILFRILTHNNYLHTLSWGIIAPLLDGIFLTWLLRREYSQPKTN